MYELTVEILEARREKMMLGVAEFSEWLGFETKSKNRTRALISRYREFCKAIAGVQGYSAGIKVRRRVTNKIFNRRTLRRAGRHDKG